MLNMKKRVFVQNVNGKMAMPRQISKNTKPRLPTIKLRGVTKAVTQKPKNSTT